MPGKLNKTDLYKCHCCREELADEELFAPYCRRCALDRKHRKRFQDRDAQFSKWFRDVGTQHAKEAAELTHELIFQMGGRVNIATEMAHYYMRMREYGDPKDVHDFFNQLMRMMILAYPPKKNP